MSDSHSKFLIFEVLKINTRNNKKINIVEFYIIIPHLFFCNISISS